MALVTASKENWVVAIDAIHGNPHDGHTLQGSIEQTKQISDWQPVHTYCDQGYRGATTVVSGTTVHLTNKQKGCLSYSAWRWFRRRSAIEPVCGPLKSDNGLERNYFRGKEGDRINVVLSGCGFNLRKLVRAFFLFLFFCSIWTQKI